MNQKRKIDQFDFEEDLSSIEKLSPFKTRSQPSKVFSTPKEDNPRYQKQQKRSQIKERVKNNIFDIRKLVSKKPETSKSLLSSNDQSYQRDLENDLNKSMVRF